MVNATESISRNPTDQERLEWHVQRVERKKLPATYY